MATGKIIRRTVDARVCLPEVAGEPADRLVRRDGAGRHMEDAVFRPKLVDCSATPLGIALAEDFLQVAVEQFADAVQGFHGLEHREFPAKGGPSDLCLTAVDEELDAVDVGGFFGGQEHHRLGDLFGLADIAGRDLADQIVLCLRLIAAAEQIVEACRRWFPMAASQPPGALCASPSPN